MRFHIKNQMHVNNLQIEMFKYYCNWVLSILFIFDVSVFFSPQFSTHTHRQSSCILFAIVAMVTICCTAANASKIVDVKCTNETQIPAECFIKDSFQYEYGDQLTIELNATQRANEIFEFGVTYNANVQSIPPQLWKQLPHLEHLKLRGVGLQHLHASDFENAWDLHNLTLSYNNLTIIPSALFSRAVKLIQINLEANQIRKVEDYAFNGLYQLYYLSLSRNHIVTLSSDVFSGAPHLIDLRLEHNSISTLQPGVFELPDLAFLYLGNNQLKTLPDDCFKHTQLFGLDLQSNDLERISNAIYTAPKTLHMLLLSFNSDIKDLNSTYIHGEFKNLDTFKYDPHLDNLLS